MLLLLAARLALAPRHLERAVRRREWMELDRLA
jgi:hypothetical protein